VIISIDNSSAHDDSHIKLADFRDWFYPRVTTQFYDQFGVPAAIHTRGVHNAFSETVSGAQQKQCVGVD